MKWKTITIQAGIFLMILGLQLRAVESFVLRPETTRILANLTSTDRDTTPGMVRQFVVENTPIKKVLTPPPWLGWAMISGGLVLTTYAWRKMS